MRCAREKGTTVKLPTVFIASSSEGLEVAKTVRALLLQELREKAKVTPWTREFDLSATYIESLEKASQEADFAVLVVTPDDITISRDKKKSAPRDNVVFELGLFMGCLGRQRCFIVNEEKSDLKLPTDLLGVHLATFRRSAGQELRDALDAQCLLIGERIAKLGARYKFSKDVLGAQAAIRRFCESIEGAWWERITREDPSPLSFFRIETDDVFNSVSLTGRSYDKEGRHAANWKSVIVRIDQDENKLLYHWRGWYLSPEIANVPFHGFGEMEFDKPLTPGDVVNRGGGKFWNVDEAHPENTIVKPIQLRCVQGDSAISTMTSGNEKAVRSLIKRTLLEW
jgi:hypothetical protein